MTVISPAERAAHPEREPGYHCAEAVRLAEIAADKAITSADYAAAAQVHAALAAQEPASTDEAYWTQARQLEELRDAVRDLVGAAEWSTASNTRIAVKTPHAERLRKLIAEDDS